ncbi:hypothetical protein [Agrococcus sp. ARC_14]|uniref:hypothetical protein n=1 Tax=Agrococcus sp. ARC_14 TaxID=2919927 RepID=UPI001F058EB7|nr:hypothetical protein [Agrococcus sp. ARC_14]MCH1881974.1 hypothetical protein [Agrococcus sp. ARC_14]
MIQALAPTGTPRRAPHPVAITGSRALAAVALHALLLAAIVWASDPVISETPGWGWPSAALVSQYGLLWVQTAIVPALVWGAFVVARAASRRRVEGTAFVLSAIVVAIVAFAAAVPLIVLQVPVQAPGIAISAWLLAGCAGVVVVAAQVARDRRAARRTA